MTREELKAQIDELMRQYADEEIDGATYQQKMMELKPHRLRKKSTRNDNQLVNKGSPSPDIFQW